ncbi:hypothetical protein BGW37DRAFT_483140 [Umbelopsis sp. PMI_123]|nr:hypothetical protein BGW37DRAFT_483140 [Umbelopsis sp. PMI_123]
MDPGRKLMNFHLLLLAVVYPTTMFERTLEKPQNTKLCSRSNLLIIMLQLNHSRSRVSLDILMKVIHGTTTIATRSSSIFNLLPLIHKLYGMPIATNL